MNLTAPASKAPDGKPDLSGVWESSPEYFNDLARDLKPGELLMLPWAKNIQAERESRDHRDDPLNTMYATRRSAHQHDDSQRPAST